MKMLTLILAATAWMGFQSAFADELFDVGLSKEHFNNGLKLYFQENYSEAVGQFEKSIQINPENAKAYYFIGYSHYKTDKFTKASKAFAAAYELDSIYTPISP